jgi:hypothetical protein
MPVRSSDRIGDCAQSLAEIRLTRAAETGSSPSTDRLNLLGIVQLITVPATENIRHSSGSSSWDVSSLTWPRSGGALSCQRGAAVSIRRRVDADEAGATPELKADIAGPPREGGAGLGAAVVSDRSDSACPFPSRGAVAPATALHCATLSTTNLVEPIATWLNCK